jgi:sugar porter (SP) family MFS transporter
MRVAGMASNRNVYISFVFIAAGGLLFGYIIGLNSNIVTPGQLLCKDSMDDYKGTKPEVGSWTSFGYNQCYKLDPLQSGLFSSLNLIGATISSLVCFRFSDNLGRKLEVQLGAILYALGSIIAAASPNLIGNYVGFSIYGLGIGFAMHAAPVYIAEISPADIRGTMVSGKEAVVVLGIFLGFFFGWAFGDIETYGWRIGAFVPAVLALVMGVGISFIPQSPRFLVLRAVVNGDLLDCDSRTMQDARAALRFFRRADSLEGVSAECGLMHEEVSASVGTEVAKVTDAFKYPRPLLIGCGVVFLQQVTGQPSVLYFATNIFKSAGFGSLASIASVVVSAAKLIATLFTVWRVDQYGRRLLLFVGISMMALSLAVLGTAFNFQTCKGGVAITDCREEDIELPQAWGVATVVALMVYVSGYQVGFGPIAWLLISEVFPLKVRGAALSVAAIVNFGSNITMTLTLPLTMKTFGSSVQFFIYLALAILSIAFVYFIVPETKGKTLEEIERDLTSGRSKSTTVGVSRSTSLMQAPGAS